MTGPTGARADDELCIFGGDIEVEVSRTGSTAEAPEQGEIEALPGLMRDLALSAVIEDGPDWPEAAVGVEAHCGLLSALLQRTAPGQITGPAREVLEVIQDRREGSCCPTLIPNERFASLGVIGPSVADWQTTVPGEAAAAALQEVSGG